MFVRVGRSRFVDWGWFYYEVFDGGFKELWE